MRYGWFVGIVLSLSTAGAAPWTEANAPWNVNLNPDGSDPSKYYGGWPGHPYYPSSDDWRREAVYQVMTDRFRDGDPTNNDGKYGGYDVTNFQKRQGGDFRGLAEKLDYIKSLGFTAIWITQIFQNLENEYHGYGPLDFTLIDDRFGTLADFRALVAAAHARGMYVFVDVVVNHMSYLYYAEGYEKSRAPSRIHEGEYRLLPRNPKETYADFNVDNTFQPEGHYPDVYGRDGFVRHDVGKGSYWGSDFHHNGDLTDYRDPWNNELGAIYGRFNDLRNDHPRVQAKIIAMTKALISSTDIDGLRVDTPMQVGLGFFKAWIPALKEHAARLGKKDFLIFGETYCVRSWTATMVGRGKTPAHYRNDKEFIDDIHAMDGGINYVFYKGFMVPALFDGRPGALSFGSRVLGDDFLSYDLWDPVHKETRYRMLNFFGSHDQRRLSTMEDGLAKAMLASGIVAFWPGIPLFFQGDEQGFSSYGNGLDGHARESLMASVAWENQPAAVKPNPAGPDNFNMTSPAYRKIQRYMNVRRQYPALWTSDRIVQRALQEGGGPGYLLFTRRSPDDRETPVLVAFNTSSKVVKVVGAVSTDFSKEAVLINVLKPKERFTLDHEGRINGLSIDPYEMKLLVPENAQKELAPVVEEMVPYHEAVVSAGSAKITIRFSSEMDEESVRGAFRYDGKKPPVAAIHYDRGTRTVQYHAPVTPGIHHVTILESAMSRSGKNLLGTFESRFRNGAKQNVLVNRTARYDTTLIERGKRPLRDPRVRLFHKAVGAEYFRVSWNNGGSWTPWKPYQAVSEWKLPEFNGWKELTVQYWADGSGAYQVRAGIDLFIPDGVEADEPIP
ncbi:MAG: alpha-amylase family glycosyl hydrolase [Pseudomonadota bacterium]